MSQFLNPGFETVDGVTGLPTGWTITNDRFIAGQQFTIGGQTYTSPLDPTYPTANANSSLADDDAIAGFSYTAVISTAQKTAGNNSLELTSNGTSVSYGVVRGPWVYSSEFAVTGGQDLKFDWQAQGGSDAFDVFGFLLNTTTGATQIVLNETGGFTKAVGSGTWGRDTGGWISSTVNVTDSGNYRFVFLSGTFDESGGRALGAKLFLDNFGGAAVFGDLQYSANTFSEASANDGTIANTITLTLNSNTDFVAGPFVLNTHYTITGVPAGLTAVVTRTGDKGATIQLTGPAAAHANLNDISNIAFSFTDAAFTGGAVASTIGGATSKKLYIDYIDEGNTAPTRLGDLTIATILEDATPAGVAISAMTGLSFVDANGAGTLGGVVVVGNTAASATEGVWQYSTNAGTNWSAIGTVSNTAGLSLSKDTLLRFLPAKDYNGNPPSLTVRALDNTAGLYSATGTSESRVLLDASNNGGSTPIAATTNTISIGSVTAVNDAPTFTKGANQTVDDNAGAQSTASWATAISKGPTDENGQTLTFNVTNNNNTLFAVQPSLALDGTLTYTPAADQSGTATVTVTLSDDGGTADGGADSSQQTFTITVRDAPTITNLNGDTPSGTSGSAIKLDAGTAANVTDVDSANFNTGTLTITTTSGTADGNWSLDGTNAKAGVDVGTANTAIAANEKIYIGSTHIGTVHATETGQAVVKLTITFNASATPALVSTLLQNLSYTSSTTGARNFDVVVKDASAGATSSTSTVTLTVNNPPSDSGPSTPPVTVTTVDGATVTSSTTTTTDGRVLEVVTIAPVTNNRQETTGGTDTADIALYYGDSASTVPATTASLPTGIGLTSTGARTPANNTEALANLIALVNQTAGNTETNRVDMVSGGESFLARLDQQADKGPLIVNSIKLTVAPGQTTAPDKPITITGSTDRVVQGSGNGNGGAPVEAIVIDTRALPPGTVLELKDIEFAVIVGDNVTIRGGEGKNIVFAGSGSQNIVLGEGDDELYGGDGDDVIGSEGGDDRLFGNAGNDTLFGGAGNDLLHGGVGNDVATYTGNRDQYEIVRDHGKTIVRSLSRSDDVDTVVNIETLRFDDSTYSIENPVQLIWIATLYQEVLGRQAELGGFQYWAAKHEAGLGIGTIALSFLHSAEYNTGASQQFAELSASDQLNLLYEHFLGRGADASGHAYWMEHMGNGMNINDVAQYFVVSNEMQGSYVQASGWEFFV